MTVLSFRAVGVPVASVCSHVRICETRLSGSEALHSSAETSCANRTQFARDVVAVDVGADLDVDYCDDLAFAQCQGFR